MLRYEVNNKKVKCYNNVNENQFLNLWQAVKKLVENGLTEEIAVSEIKIASANAENFNNSEKTFHEINFSPYANNILDFIEVPNLRTEDQKIVFIEFSINGIFKIHIGDEIFQESSNIAASYILNKNNVGIFG